MKIGARNFSEVKVENVTDTILVPVSTGKPEIPDDLCRKWQKLIELSSKILNVSVSIITRFSEENLAIYITGEDASNPFAKSSTAPLGSGLFCETVAGRKEPLIVENIEHSDFWRENPLVATGMRSYYGVPIQWEDGDLFGTLCILNAKVNSFPSITGDVLDNFKDMIESDLKFLLLNADLQKKLSEQEILIRESHHRINNHFTMLISYIQLKVSEGNDTRRVQDILLDIQNRIRSISVIHEELCSASLQRKLPPLDEYLSHLCNCLVANVSDFSIALDCTVEAISLPVERSVSIGLIIAELVTNSIKHAFTNNNPPAITVKVLHREPGRISIYYHDNGIGFPADYTITDSSTLGMNLIAMQVAQLHGTLNIDGSNGTTIRIEIDG